MKRPDRLIVTWQGRQVRDHQQPTGPRSRRYSHPMTVHEAETDAVFAQREVADLVGQYDTDHGKPALLDGVN